MDVTGEHPFGIAFDTKNNQIFTTIPNIDAISIITTEDIDINEKPLADAGPDQTVKSNNIVQLDGSNSTDPNGSPLNYNWIQTSGREVSLSDPSTSHPTFTAPKTNEPTKIVFEFIVTNKEGVISAPDDLITTVNPIATPPPVEEQPRTIGNLIKSIIQNPLDVTNSIEAANEIENIITGGDRNNDHEACSLLENLDTEVTTTLRNVLEC
ncbi:MAG: PKD domain-containing protein [Candidatus Nitrosocosmicus sp.]